MLILQRDFIRNTQNVCRIFQYFFSKVNKCIWKTIRGKGHLDLASKIIQLCTSFKSGILLLMVFSYVCVGLLLDLTFQMHKQSEPSKQLLCIILRHAIFEAVSYLHDNGNSANFFVHRIIHGGFYPTQTVWNKFISQKVNFCNYLGVFWKPQMPINMKTFWVEKLSY